MKSEAKILSVVVPCYNSEAYMEKCIETLLHGGENVEILIIDDGSTDHTGEIADSYAMKYPAIIKAFHQENGGHGAAINTGLTHAKGCYFKVVDSDDWVDIDAYKRIVKTLDEFCAQLLLIDMLISNYVYEKLGAKYKKVMRYKNALPRERIFTWDDIGSFKRGQYILMHSVIYRTALLRDCGLSLPRHTFYVDNLFVYIPMTRVKRMYYMDVDFYRYYIGREDQSVHESVMIRRIDQQLKVNRIMVDAVNLENIENKKHRSLMFRYLEIVTTVSSILLIKSGTQENLQKKRELWEYIKNHDRNVYNKLSFGLLGIVLNFSGKFGRSLSLLLYKISQKVVGFN